MAVWKPLALLSLVGLGLTSPTVELSKSEQFGLQIQLCQQAMAASKPSKCKLFGKIEIVTAFPDVKVEKVTAFADIKVEWVTAFADKPGKWEKVTAFPNYKVQFVDAFPDYKVEFVTAFPGCN
jgi:hypothetical protein